MAPCMARLGFVVTVHRGAGFLGVCVADNALFLEFLMLLDPTEVLMR